MKRFLPSAVMRPKTWAIVYVIAMLVYGAAIAYIAVSASTAQSRLDKQEALTQAQRAAAQQAEVTVCRRQVAGAPVTLKILVSLKGVFESRIETSRAAIAASSDAELNEVREESIARDLEAIDSLEKIVEQTRRQTPTAEKCDQLARKYGIGGQQEGE